MKASVKQNPSPERDFAGTVQNSANDLQKLCFVRGMTMSRSRRGGEGLLAGLRNECLWRIEEAAAPEGLIRQCAGLPLLKSGQGRRCHPTVL
jgi:hypothetical protein